MNRKFQKLKTKIVFTRFAQIFIPIILLTHCKSRNYNSSKPKMVLNSSAQCNSALTNFVDFKNLSPRSDDDFLAANEVCSDATVNSGFAEIGDGSSKALCSEAHNQFPQINELKFIKWSALSAIPISMSCNSFQKSGASHYGRKASKQVYKIFLRSLIPKELSPMKETTLKKCSEELKKPDISFLVFANQNMPMAVNKDFSNFSTEDRIRYLDENFSVRGTLEGIRKGDVFQGIPMTQTESDFLKSLWPDGTMHVENISEPFMSYDVTPPAMVSGDFAFHPPSSDICSKLTQFQLDIERLQQLKNDSKSYLNGVAELTRRCIAVHPFGDGNGRTCGMWSVFALTRNKQLPSVRWPHEDYSLSLSSYQSKFLEGIENSVALLKSIDDL